MTTAKNMKVVVNHQQIHLSGFLCVMATKGDYEFEDIEAVKEQVREKYGKHLHNVHVNVYRSGDAGNGRMFYDVHWEIHISSSGGNKI